MHQRAGKKLPGFCFPPPNVASLDSLMRYSNVTAAEIHSRFPTLAPARLAATLAAFLLLAPTSRAWDYEGHRLINEIALASLPTNFPAFVFTPAAAERIAFLGGEADRWRNSPDLPLRHHNGPDHYIDLEELFQHGLTLETTPPLRYEFITHLATNRFARPDAVPFVDPAKDKDRTRALVGLLPWTIAEYQGRLKSGFSYLKAYQDYGGTGDEIANAQANIIYIMGVMGHFAGDASQPLHTTKHHHGWVGPNPNGYATNTSIHQWIDGGYLNKVGIPTLEELRPRLRPARPLEFNGRPAAPDEIFPATLRFIEANWKLVEPLYQLDKEGAFSGNGEEGRRGRAFLTDRLLEAGQFLGDLWLTAWQQAPEDKFLRDRLNARRRR